MYIYVDLIYMDTFGDTWMDTCTFGSLCSISCGAAAPSRPRRVKG